MDGDVYVVVDVENSSGRDIGTDIDGKDVGRWVEQLSDCITCTIGDFSILQGAGIVPQGRNEKKDS